MNTHGLILITVALVIWSTAVQYTIPSREGRVVIGILGAAIIGGGFALKGITLLGGY
jgi:hypothetical protein